MFRLRAFRRLFSWVALLAILGGALAPAVSHAVYSQTGKSFLEICTAQGTRLIAVDADADPVTGGQHNVVMEHCPFCVPHAGSLGLLPTAELVFKQPADGSRFYPPLFYTAPRPLFAWASAQPRAPPVLSV
jgi:uncharacterized SAM-binding protein YcdF (DUF218 family)